MGKTLSYVGKGFGLLMTGMTYVDSRKQGDGVGTALVKTIGSEIFYSTPIGQAITLSQLGVAGAGLALDIGRQNASVSHRAHSNQFGGNLNLSQNGYTMRQRGINAISRSNMNVTNALGSEARSFHKGHFID